MEKFIAGLAVGSVMGALLIANSRKTRALAVGSVMGALLIANSRKTRALLQRGQEELKARVDAYIDERLAAMDKADACGKGACTEN